MITLLADFFPVFTVLQNHVPMIVLLMVSADRWVNRNGADEDDAYRMIRVPQKQQETGNYRYFHNVCIQ